MPVKFDCEFYYPCEVQSKAIHNTFDEAEHRIIHNCRHKANHPHLLLRKPAILTMTSVRIILKIRVIFLIKDGD